MASVSFRHELSAETWTLNNALSSFQDAMQEIVLVGWEGSVLNWPSETAAGDLGHYRWELIDRRLLACDKIAAACRFPKANRSGISGYIP